MSDENSRRERAIERACKAYPDGTTCRDGIRRAIEAYEAAMAEPPTPEERAHELVAPLWSWAESVDSIRSVLQNPHVLQLAPTSKEIEKLEADVAQTIRDAIEDDRRERDGHV